MNFPQELLGTVWHTTSIERYKMIVRDGCIKANPSLPDSERWGTKLGEEHFPFVRSLGGVSVFDFRNFDVNSYSKKFGAANWATFVPCRSDWRSAVWVEIDFSSLGGNFISGQSIREMWYKMDSTRKFITQIEGAVIGVIPTSAFKQVLFYDTRKSSFSRLA
ncbi:conserved hypothetical protein [Shewanella sp. MR-4]|uniref:hypothetical protein n=1 Tax=Shewanella sp. (strain MR-4) TaxID=60480 RepID=UPI0000DE1C40|nr:hypothetical protein [Shewanella sp. MR-4]ABI38919.1 conserved hypothetical protein [Shewanella sp. MR-4]